MAAVPLLIVLDISMPVLDGRGFLKRRAKDPVLLGIPVVVVSGSDVPASPPMNIKAYLQKPVSMKRLMSIIEQLCRGSTIARSSRTYPHRLSTSVSIYRECGRREGRRREFRTGVAPNCAPAISQGESRKELALSFISIWRLVRLGHRGRQERPSGPAQASDSKSDQRPCEHGLPGSLRITGDISSTKRL